MASRRCPRPVRLFLIPFLLHVLSLAQPAAAATSDCNVDGLENQPAKHQIRGTIAPGVDDDTLLVRANADMAVLEGQGELSMEAGVGLEAVGYCLKTRSLACRPAGANFVCD
ncbi:MAG: hypothetical protein ABR538_06235 [Candidatus Binatia bacterium]